MGSRVVSEYVIRLKNETSRGSKDVAKSLYEVAKAEKAIAGIGKYKKSLRSLRDLRKEYASTQSEIKRLAAAMKEGGSATASVKKEFDAAVRAAQKAKSAYVNQRNAVRSNASALQQAGINVRKLASDEIRLKQSVEQTTQAMKRQARQMQARINRRNAAGAALGSAGLYVGYRAKQLGINAVTQAADFDIGVRKQRNYAGISKESQDKLLIPQAKRIGQETQYTNLDIVKAQTAVMTKVPDYLPRAEIGQGIVEHVKNYALAMEADMATSSEAIVNFLQQTRKDISTKENALKEAQSATNFLIRMAKMGGMSDEDVQQFMKYAAPSGTVGGLSQETLGALAITGRRGGLRGDEQGTFVRTLASKLNAPTRKGLDALHAMGINYSDYVGMPDKLKVGAFEGAFKEKFGMALSKQARGRLNGIFNNQELLGDRGKFIEAVTQSLAPMFPKNKKGQLAAKDRNMIAKTAESFHKYSAESINSEALLEAILRANPTLAQLNAFLTDKQGGRGAITAGQWEDFLKAREELKSTPDDFAKNIADDIMGGLGGAFERLKGSVETFTQSVGEANAGWLSRRFDDIGNFIDRFAQLGSTTQQVVSIVGGLAATGATLYGSGRIFGIMMGGAALKGSAAALSGAAVSLEAAAVALGGKGAAGSAIANGAKAAAGGGILAAGTVAAGAIGIGVAGAVLAGEETGKALEEGNYVVNPYTGGLHPVPAKDDNGKPLQDFDQVIWSRVKSLFGASSEAPKSAGFNLGFNHDPGVAITASGIDEVTAKAKEAGQDIQSSLSINAKPQVDTSSLERALQLALQLKSTVDSIGSVSVGSSRSVRNVHADTGLGIP